MPIFVVQKHTATRLHYDFRLEMPLEPGKENVLKSWAIPKEPPTEPKIKRLAIQVEDHPLSYASFEGTIPEGQYGAGKVEIWDKGRYELIELEENSIKFKLFGKKLNGSFALFHPKTFKEGDWLLIKH